MRLQVPDESELVRLMGRGDEAAFRALVEGQARYLFGVAHALTGNATDAEDLVQETFLGAFKGRFRGQSSVRTWLVGILVRQAGMLWRSRRRHPEEPLRAPDGGAALQLAPSDAADARMDLTTMLDGLSAEHRAVIVLRELQGLSYEEMAAALGVPRGTVESRLHRAREELRRQFAGYLHKP